MPNFNGAELAALDGGAQRTAIFFRLDTAPIVRLWLGVGDFKVPVGKSTHDPGGARYTGFGQLPALPSFKQVLNGRAERIEVTLSGVSDEILVLAEGDAERVKHRACDIGFGLLGDAWQMLGAVHWLRRGYVDYLSLSRAGSGEGEGMVQTVSLAVSGLMTGRRRPGLSYWTDQDQQRRHPGDRFCERTVNMTEYAKTWPRFSEAGT